ncbi:hypothetical protein [Actinomadura citrea]|uniref:Uncharacterized protein n=1 Tax=Actinomadura citrea TaxID=46158 RepID=A0A7Y9GI76_9ACTN|nr:hypothetical protein [Actinomadura citrea]NYE16932.1 hypothetical protein [Actinomadura citrea]
MIALLPDEMRWGPEEVGVPGRDQSDRQIPEPARNCGRLDVLPVQKSSFRPPKLFLGTFMAEVWDV